MSSPAVSVPPDMPLRKVAALLAERGISGVPVVLAGEVVGVVSEADIVVHETGRELARLKRRAPWRRPTSASTQRVAKTAGEAMTSPAITIAPWRPASAAAALMVERGIKRLPVVRQGQLIGVIARSDLVRA